MESSSSVARFILKGSYMTDLARQSFSHGGYGWAINLIVNTLEGIRPEQALEIAVGTKKIEGDSSSGMTLADDICLNDLDSESIFRLVYRNEVEDAVVKCCKRNCESAVMRVSGRGRRKITLNSHDKNGDMWVVQSDRLDSILIDMIKVEVNGRHYPEWVRRQMERDEEERNDHSYDAWKDRQKRRNKKFGGAVAVYGDNCP